MFDTTRADRIIRWFGQCIQVRGVEQARAIELQPWQVFDLGCTYGWVHKDTGARRFSRTYNKRARGNFKSTEKSGQALYHMCGDAMYPPYHPELAVFEREPEVECAAVGAGERADGRVGIHVTTTCGVTGKTGIEMEALTAASVACLTVYDMCKAVDRGMEICDVRLLKKDGGKSGLWMR